MAELTSEDLRACSEETRAWLTRGYAPIATEEEAGSHSLARMDEDRAVFNKRYPPKRGRPNRWIPREEIVKMSDPWIVANLLQENG